MTKVTCQNCENLVPVDPRVLMELVDVFAKETKKKQEELDSLRAELASRIAGGK